MRGREKREEKGKNLARKRAKKRKSLHPWVIYLPRDMGQMSKNLEVYFRRKPSLFLRVCSNAKAKRVKRKPKRVSERKRKRKRKKEKKEMSTQRAVSQRQLQRSARNR